MDSNLTIALAGTELLAFVFQAWALITAFRYPNWAWHESGHSRGMWLALLVLAFFMAWCGVLLSAWFLIGPSGEVRRVAKLGARPGFPGR